MSVCRIEGNGLGKGDGGRGSSGGEEQVMLKISSVWKSTACMSSQKASYYGSKHQIIR